MNHVTYTRPNGDEIKLKINCERALELEEKLGVSVNAGLAETDKVSKALIFIACALPEGSFKERMELAGSIYDEIIECGGKLTDVQLLIMEVLEKSGFMSGEELKAVRLRITEREKRLAEKNAKAQERMEASLSLSSI